jgi:FG-GAP-like repeat
MGPFEPDRWGTTWMRASIGCALLPLIMGAAVGQTLFDAPTFISGNVPYQWPDSPKGALVADVNADGFLDSITGASHTNRIDVFFGDGQGGLVYGATTFVPQPSTPPMCNPVDTQWPASVADLDGDVFPDIICAVGDGFQPHLNLGNGQFQSLPIVTGVYTGSRYTADDIDNDGNVDVIAAGPINCASSQFSLRVFSWINGAFVPAYQSVLPIPDQFQGALVMDLNQDGLKDIVCPYWSPTAHGLMLFVQGSGMSFVNVGPITIPNSPQCSGCLVSISGLYTADFNGDGLSDVVATGAQGPSLGTIWVFPGSVSTLLGTPTLQMPAGLSNQSLAGQVARIVDVDLDGIADLVYPQQSPLWTTYPDVFRVGGIYSTTTPFLSAPTAYVFGLKTFVGAGDFDGDGDTDLVYTRGTPAGGVGISGIGLNRSRSTWACGQLSLLSLEKGTANPGNPWFALSVSGAPAGAAVAFGVSSAMAGWYSNGCVAWLSLLPSDLLLPTPTYGVTLAAGNGIATLPIPIPNVPGFLGSSYVTQAIAVDPVGQFAVGGVGFAISDLRTILVW